MTSRKGLPAVLPGLALAALPLGAVSLAPANLLFAPGDVLTWVLRQVAMAVTRAA